MLLVLQTQANLVVQVVQVALQELQEQREQQDQAIQVLLLVLVVLQDQPVLQVPQEQRDKVILAHHQEQVVQVVQLELQEHREWLVQAN